MSHDVLIFPQSPDEIENGEFLLSLVAFYTQNICDKSTVAADLYLIWPLTSQIAFTQRFITLFSSIHSHNDIAHCPSVILCNIHMYSLGFQYVSDSVPRDTLAFALLKRSY